MERSFYASASSKRFLFRFKILIDVALVLCQLSVGENPSFSQGASLNGEPFHRRRPGVIWFSAMKIQFCIWNERAMERSNLTLVVSKTKGKGDSLSREASAR